MSFPGEPSPSENPCPDQGGLQKKNCKIDKKQLPPELGHFQIHFFPCLGIFGLHDGYHNGESQGQRDKKEVEECGGGKLESREE
jgi:hypothetical protein